jgi:uncharacterized protein YbjT (DUF2867 family)
VYYLVHSLGRPDFEPLDRDAARNVSGAAAAAGVSRLVYLGGPAPDDARASAHPRSRREVADILLDRPVPAIVLRPR